MPESLSDRVREGGEERGGRDSGCRVRERVREEERSAVLLSHC